MRVSVETYDAWPMFNYKWTLFGQQDEHLYSGIATTKWGAKIGAKRRARRFRRFESKIVYEGRI